MVLFTLLSWLRPYLISILVLFVPFPTNQYFVISFSIIHLFFMLICASFCLSLWSYLLLVAKTALGVFFNFVFLLAAEESAITKIAAYSVIAVGLIEMGEALFKLIRLILRNKGVINASYEPLEGRPEEVTEEMVQKRKELQNKMISFLSKARN